MITNLRNENADLPDVMNSNRKFDVSLDESEGLCLEKTTSNSCCVNLGLTGPDGVQVTTISYNIYQTLKLLVTHVVLTSVTLDQMAYKSQ